MAYLTKETVLEAYKILSGIDIEKQQGLTQKVSALKYASALDSFYKAYTTNCDLKETDNRDKYSLLVGNVVKINDKYCTKDFFKSTSQNGRDYDCGSNFFSQSSVKESKLDPVSTFAYPKRSGWKPVMDVRNQVLIYRPDYLRDAFSYYLVQPDHKLAYIVWLLRFSEINQEDIDGLIAALRNYYTDDFCNALLTEGVRELDGSYISYATNMCQLEVDDIVSLYDRDVNITTNTTTDKTTNYKLPLQQIYYGAPGTGKSHTVNKIVEGATVFRTTFHPDSDYSTFVGAYKPIEVESPVTHVVWDSVAKIAKSFPVVDQANHPVLEKKITYKYVQQAFTKAYIEAWKRIFEITRLSVASPMPSASVSGSAASSASSGTNSISRMTDAEIVLIRRIMVRKTGVKIKWNKWFQNGTYSPVSNPSRSGDSDYCAATDLVHNNADDSCRNKNAFDDAWKQTIDKLRANSPQTAKNPNSNGKEYSFSADEVSYDWIWAESRMTKGKETLRGYWSGSSVPKGIEKDIIGKLRELDDDFDKAWDKLKPEEDGLGNSIDTGFDNFGANDKGRGEIIISRDVDSEEGSEDESIAFDPVYLVIEEINRGNCAQIFGDIFQLLDRNDNGFSVYPIMPDQDLSNELKNSFAACDVSPDVKDYINRMYKDGDVVRKVLTGEVLVIPASLSILATMNTSDQSLFPMDSAFKRRWDWIYEPIVEGMQVDEQGEKSDSQTPLGWKIEVDDTHSVDWWKFLQKINAVISSLTSSEDKQLGYFFCRPDSNDGITISKKRFVGKVVFYLWNEIFKDYAFEHDVCKKDADGKKETLYFADFYEGKNNINQTSLVTFFKHLDENQPKIDNKDVKLIEMVPDASSAPKTPDGAETPTESDTEHAEETPDETPEA